MTIDFHDWDISLTVWLEWHCDFDEIYKVRYIFLHLCVPAYDIYKYINIIIVDFGDSSDLAVTLF